MRSLRPILLVEDDNVDAMTIRRAMKELKVSNQLVRVINGEEALTYLRQESNRKPCVILLDLNTPRMSGIEFLKVAKADDDLKAIPVIVLTTSRADQDKFDSFNLNVAGYVVKPVDYSGFVESMRILDMYWTLSQLPGEEL